MKKITKLVPRWRISALACTAALLLAGCGAATDGGLSNGPQMAATSTDVPENGAAPAAAAEPADVAEPAVAPPEAVAAAPAPAPTTAPAGANAQPAAQAGQADPFAMTGYGNAAKPSGDQADSQGAAGQDPAATSADPASRAAATAVPDGANRSYGPSGAGFAAADTEPEMCKYGGCSFR